MNESFISTHLCLPLKEKRYNEWSLLSRSHCLLRGVCVCILAGGRGGGEGSSARTIGYKSDSFDVLAKRHHSFKAKI